MASTLQMFTAGMMLISATILLIVLAFFTNVILSPILSIVGSLMGPGPLLVSDVSYIIPGLWILFILYEIVSIISFIIVVSRRNEVGYDTYI